MINHSSIFCNFSILHFYDKVKINKKLCTEICKLSYSLGVYPLYARSEVYFKVFCFRFKHFSIFSVSSFVFAANRHKLLHTLKIVYVKKCFKSFNMYRKAVDKAWTLLSSKKECLTKSGQKVTQDPHWNLLWNI